MTGTPTSPAPASTPAVVRRADVLISGCGPAGATAAAHLAAAGLDVAHHELASPWGHDSFLLEPPGYHALVAEHLAS